MQIFPSAPVRLLMLPLAFLPPAALSPFVLAASAPAPAAAPTAAKTHSITLGPVRKVPFTPPTAASALSDPTAKPSDGPTLKVRPLLIDGRQREWTTGDAHDVTDRSFTIRRALHLNDQLPADQTPRWSWQPGPWLLVDRTTGRITALHLPDFDPAVSEAVWFRDYAAYCGAAQTVKGGLLAIVAQLGARRAVVSKRIGKWPQPSPPKPVCKAAVWQRDPLRVTLQPTGGDPLTFDVVGAASLIEESDDTADDN
jgi:hypothetical protein